VPPSTAARKTSPTLKRPKTIDDMTQASEADHRGLETWYIYGIGGELLAEYAAGGAT